MLGTPDSEHVSGKAFLTIAAARRGHFRLESGHHSGLWFDLNALFTDSRRSAPFITDLSRRLQRYDVTGVCGPLTGGAFLAQRIAGELGVSFFFTERFRPTAEDESYSVEYRLPAVAESLILGQRIAIVDDVMSAGSALRGTYTNVRTHGANVAVVGALMVLGSVGSKLFEVLDVPVEAVTTHEYAIWLPDQCPLCGVGVPLEDAPT